jgi:hypothetical protein
MCSAPRSKPFDVQGVPQQVPAASGGIHTGLPARAETWTRASTSQRCPPARETPNMRLMQAGR